MAEHYTELDVDRVVATLEMLSHRVEERFPEGGLRGVCRELQVVGAQAKLEIEDLRHPIWLLRIATFSLIALMLLIVVLAVLNVRVTEDTFHLTNLVDLTQNIIQDFVWLGIGIYFLVRLEASAKRKRVFKTLHKLRSIAHVIDMHQLTKDPYRISTSHVDTASSPTLKLSPLLLRRYLDYCSEMLSLTGKIAALYLRDFDDAGVVAAVTEVEDLTAGLSRKIWQKISSIPEID